LLAQFILRRCGRSALDYFGQTVNIAAPSKLITVYRGDWSKRLCNSCYGRLLSIYEIKAANL